MKNKYTEAELVSAINYVTYKIWYIMFMNHQGYLNKPNKLFQENQSTPMMDINGRNYCTYKYHQIDIIYFFIKYPVDKG